MATPAMVLGLAVQPRWLGRRLGRSNPASRRDWRRGGPGDADGRQTGPEIAVKPGSVDSLRVEFPISLLNAYAFY
jgi:hypothetical protein